MKKYAIIFKDHSSGRHYTLTVEASGLQSAVEGIMLMPLRF